jgi:hypothetical protein
MPDWSGSKMGSVLELFDPELAKLIDSILLNNLHRIPQIMLLVMPVLTCSCCSSLGTID